ncbi:ProQ/FINO family protein [Acidovorax sp. FG27]|uniref:ProQ/FINO family protein n=1 Tax=Acidovorax sp. FG27 TaxID=3133652 RepID=UPI0030EA6E6A
MTDNATAPESQNPAPAAGAEAPAMDGQSATPAEAGAAGAGGEARAPRSRRGGRGRSGGGGGNGQNRQPADSPAAGTPPKGPSGPRRTHPALEQLAGFYPHLFGAQFLPLKRGIFQDLQDAHPGVFEKEDLKAALGIHTRSTRYLQVVAEGRQRHDLSGQPVEAMAPEHVHHALLEVFRRKKPRDGEDLVAKLRRRIAQAYEASGLTREAYDALVRGRDERANALLDEAFAEVAERDARAEALLRAYEASGCSSVEQFADMYGMDARTAERQLQRGRQLHQARATAAAAAPVDQAEPSTGA